MISGTISASDYLNAQRLHLRRQFRWVYTVAAVLVIVGVGLYLLGQVWPGFPLILSGLLGAATEFVMSTFYLPRKVQRLHKQQKDFESPSTYNWDTEFLHSQHASGHAKRPWSNFVRIRENDEIFLLYHSDNLFEMLPKSWFATPSLIEEFRSLAERAERV